MERVVEVGVLDLWEELMVVGYGRILEKVQTIFSVMWCMQRERAIIFGSGTTLQVVLFLWKNYTRNCLLVVQEALISDMVIFAPDGGGRSWNFLFHCNFNEWELRRSYSFYEHISARIPSGEGENILIWQLNRIGVFDVWSFYIALLKAPSISFLWQNIWCVKVPKRVSFFLWTAARGGILTIDS